MILVVISRSQRGCAPLGCARRSRSHCTIKTACTFCPFRKESSARGEGGYMPGDRVPTARSHSLRDHVRHAHQVPASIAWFPSASIIVISLTGHLCQSKKGLPVTRIGCFYVDVLPLDRLFASALCLLETGAACKQVCLRILCAGDALPDGAYGVRVEAAGAH